MKILLTTNEVKSMLAENMSMDLSDEQIDDVVSGIGLDVVVGLIMIAVPILMVTIRGRPNHTQISRTPPKPRYVSRRKKMLVWKSLRKHPWDTG